MENDRGVESGKAIAVISYFTVIGWVIALILHSGNKTRLGAFHLRQTLGLMILIVLVGISGYILYFIPLGWMVRAALNIGLLVFWVMGLVAAVSGEEKPLPIVGSSFQKWFAGFAV